MSRWLRWLYPKLLWTLAVVGTLAALFYTVEDWRGARAWAQARQQLEARGESLDPETFIPPLIPDEQNLAMAPLFVRRFRYVADAQSGELKVGPYDSSNKDQLFIDELPFSLTKSPDFKRPTGSGSWRDGERRDLTPWQTYYRNCAEFPHSPEPQTASADVLLALTRFSPLLDELAHEAATRPLTRFPVPWRHIPAWEVGLPHYNVLQVLTSTLCLRALAELRDIRTDDAMRDLELCFRLRQASGQDPFIIASLVAMTQTGSMLQPIWEGLADRRWSAGELTRLQTHLEGINELAEFKQGIRGGERALMACSSLDSLKQAGNLREFLSLVMRMQANSEPKYPFSAIKLGLIPSGWIDQNMAVCCWFDQQVLLDPVDPARHRVNAKQVKAAKATGDISNSPYTFMASLMDHSFEWVSVKYAWGQTVVDEAAAACALERYYLDHHAYPDRLEALTPLYCERTPTDVIDGAPLHYRLTPDGRYQLYSVGWNETDDGGRPAVKSSDYSTGDWVWRYPQK